jgi:hypothetical protein
MPMQKDYYPFVYSNYLGLWCLCDIESMLARKGMMDGVTLGMI